MQENVFGLVGCTHTIVRLQAENSPKMMERRILGVSCLLRIGFGGTTFAADYCFLGIPLQRIVLVVCTRTRVKGHVLVLVIQFLFRLSRQGLSRPCVYFRLYHAKGLYHAQGYITPMYNFRLYHAKGLYHAQGYIMPRAISRPGGLYHARHTPTDYITSRAISRPCMFPRATSRPGLYHAHRGLYHIRG